MLIRKPSDIPSSEITSSESYTQFLSRRRFLRNAIAGGAAAGVSFNETLQKLGIADAVKAKAVVVQGRPVGAAIASGEAEIGVQQVAELRPVAGVDQFAELPPELQKHIPYSAGIAAKAKDAATARALVSFLRSQPALEVLKRKGMDLP